MLATCSKDPSHQRFVTTVHVVERWIVDETGEFQEVVDVAGEVAHGPDPGNNWICHECGGAAVVE